MQGGGREIVISGAGIAGLTAAIAFAANGYRVRIFERSPVLEEIGAGLQLSPNATRILDRLGVLSDLFPKAVQPESIDLRRADTLKLLSSLPLGDHALQRWGSPYLTVHRADLQNTLLRAAERHEAIDLQTGVSVEEIDFRPHGGVTLRLDRGGTAEHLDCDLAIGADGVWSTLRRRGRNRERTYSGFIAWRAMVPADNASATGLLPADRVTVFLAPRFHLVAYPVRAGEALNLVAFTKGPRSPENWANETNQTLLETAVHGAAPQVSQLVSHAGSWTTWPIHQVAIDGAWTNPSGFALIGDAAHAMPPYAAQGAAMAIEDAATLAAVFKDWPEDVAKSLATYDALRRPRIMRVSKRGAFNRFAWHASGPVAFVRDRVIAMRGPDKLAADLDWLYRWDLGQ